jgi:coiled-coil domain-containing protein 12
LPRTSKGRNRIWYVSSDAHIVPALPTSVHQDIFNIAPKRPNWDLKRELEKKRKTLERKTQEAIHTLIRPSILFISALPLSLICLVVGQRLATQKGDSDDLVGAMNADEARNEAHSDEED